MRLLEWGVNREDVVYRSKAVGEPPLMLGISVFCALRDAVASVASYEIVPQLDAPATPQRILLAVEDLRTRAKSVEGERGEHAAVVLAADGDPI